MRLTRRDAVTALVTGGAAGIAMSELPPDIIQPTPDRASYQFTDHDHHRLKAIAEVVYPSDVQLTVEDIAEFVAGLSDDRRREMIRTLDQLEWYLFDGYGRSVVELPVRRRDAALRSIGTARAGSSPEGSLPERIRFYLINQLLYLLYTTPRGSRVLDIENPVGYPGGYESYQQAPNDG